MAAQQWAASSFMLFKVPLLIFLPPLSCVLLFSACKSHKVKTDEAIAAVQQAKQNLQTNRNEQVEQAAALVYGTGQALVRVTNKEPAMLLAYDLNSRAAVVLGPPDYAEALTMNSIVQGHLSPLLAEQQASRKALGLLDQKVTDLQSLQAELKETLASKEAARDGKMVAMAADADFGRKIKRWLFWGTVFVGGGLIASIVLNAMSVGMPALIPVAKIFTGLFSLPFKLFLRSAPIAAEQLGVVSKAAHERSVNALRGVVTTVQEWKQQRDYDESVEQLQGMLSKNLDRSDKAVITETKIAKP